MSKRQTWFLSFHHSSIWTMSKSICVASLVCSEPAYLSSPPSLPLFGLLSFSTWITSAASWWTPCLKSWTLCCLLSTRQSEDLFSSMWSYAPHSLISGDGATWVWMLEWDTALKMISANYLLWLRTSQITKPLCSIYFSLKQGRCSCQYYMQECW